jgi:hypothetical protein
MRQDTRANDWWEASCFIVEVLNIVANCCHEVISLWRT